VSKKELAGGKHRRRTFFDRKVQRQEKYLAIAVTKLIPDDWDYVRLRKVDETEDSVTIHVRCLLRRGDDT